MNTNNQAVFQEIVVNPSSDKLIESKLLTEGKHTSTRKLLEAASFCRKFVASLAEKQGTDKKVQAAILFKLAKYLRDGVQVNCLDVIAPENAYTIFESLNDRGIDLSVLDLLKNYLLREAGTNEGLILNNWTKMITRIGDRKGDDFLKAYWTSRFGRIQRGRLFKELKKIYSTKIQVLKLSEDLAEVADDYANLEVADSDLWRQYSVASQEYVRSLTLLGAKQTHPILLAALSKFSPTDVEKLLQHLVVLILRYQLIGRGRTGRLEILSATVAEGIYSGKLKSTKAAWDQLRTIIPEDDEFRDDFSRYEETKAPRARWLLREFEIQQWSEENPVVAIQNAPLTDPDKVNLEHILPKNPNQDWNSVISGDKEIVSECLNRLGNLCLLDKPSNKGQAAKAFSEKALTYEKSDFLLTKQVVKDCSVWNRQAIEERQKKLANLALLRWKQ